MNYTDKILERFANPKYAGELRDANGVGKVGNARCGDIMKVYIKVEDGIITTARFQTFGCTAAIASTDVAMEMITGKTIEEALQVKNTEVIAQLGGLPANKIHCSVLAEEAIKAAITNFQRRISRAAGKDQPVKTKKETVKKAAVAKPVVEKKEKTAAVAIASKPIEIKEKSKKPEQPKVAAPTEVVVVKPEDVKLVQPSKEDEEEAVVTRTITTSTLIRNESEKTSDKKSTKKKEEKVAEAKTDDELDIFDEIDSITAKISEAVGKLKKNN